MLLNHVATAAAAALLVGSVVLSESLVKPEPRKDGRVVVTYWEKWSDFEAEAMRKVVDKFNKSQDKIFVEFSSVSNVAGKTLLATSGGIPPDIAGLFGPNVAQYAYNNAVIPLDEMAAEAGIKRDNYIHQYYDFCTYRGHLWALPTTPASTALHYNRKLLADSGWDPNSPPKTLEELTKLDEMAFKKENGVIVRMGFLPSEPGWWNWAWGPIFGGKFWNGTDKITMTDPNNIEGYTWMGSFAKRYGSGTVQSFQQGFGGFNSAQNAFMDNKVACVLQGVWMANFIEKHNPDLDWGAAPFPYPEKRPDLANSSLLDLDILVIPVGAKHPKEAFEFIKFVQQQENMELLCLGQKKHSPLAQVSPGFFENHPNPNIELFQNLSKSGTTLAPPKTPIWPQWSDEINTMVQSINSGSKTPEQALRDVQTKMQPILDNCLRHERALGIQPRSEDNGE
ncbi:MAG: ABC transporter substrate-binding protein [Armatimonadetes bacterium]|nr:ABC transporter substrate-binding protein [Armatimonadota bacterium]MBX3108218.1 ABC transporter substrate-binding protein [Fimbriimonadaceae bacterium]